MGMDRFITWGEPRSWGPPTLEKLAQAARDFLGPRWKVYISDPVWLVCECDDPMSFALAVLHKDTDYGKAMVEHYESCTRGFELYFPGVDNDSITSVITRQADDFTNALADRFAKIIARGWNGIIEWPC